MAYLGLVIGGAIIVEMFVIIDFLEFVILDL